MAPERKDTEGNQDAPAPEPSAGGVWPNRASRKSIAVRIFAAGRRFCG